MDSVFGLAADQCDGSMWEILFCEGFGAPVGLCGPAGTVNACE